MPTIKKVVAGAAAILACSGISALAVAPAADAEPTPHLSVLPEEIFLPPSPDGACSGTLRLSYDNGPDPDAVTLHADPTGSYGSAPGCDVVMNISAINGVAPFGHTIFPTVAHGPTDITVPAGRGLSMLTVNTLAPRMVGSGGYFWVQP